jgi:hypothetical protein
MSGRADLRLYDRHDRLVGLVEVKAKRGTTAEWARLTRRNMLVHGDYPDDTFFLIVTPDRLYLWDRTKATSTSAPPDVVLDAEPIFRPYFEASRLDPSKISGPAFEMVSWSLFSDLMRPSDAKEGDAFEGSGLSAAVRNGHVEYADAA